MVYPVKVVSEKGKVAWVIEASDYPDDPDRHCYHWVGGHTFYCYEWDSAIKFPWYWLAALFAWCRWPNERKRDSWKPLEYVKKPPMGKFIEELRFWFGKGT